MVNNKKLDMVKQPEMVKHLPGKDLPEGQMAREQSVPV